MTVKAALAHYWLTNLRGGEKVLAALADMLPAADVFTHAFGGTLRGGDATWRGHRVVESPIARLPLGRNHPQAYLPILPWASRQLDFSGYDLIVSSESGPIKGLRKPSGARHVCYCHTPMRYVWDMYDAYYAAAGWAERLAMRTFRDYLRKEDLKSAESVDTFVANSRFVADRIRRIYARESVVVHPPVDVAFYAGGEAAASRAGYVLAGQLVTYKRPELALAACVKMGRRLVVAGDGPLLPSLRAQFPGVTFLGRVSDERLRAEYAAAQALIFPGVEDFGIVPVEAQAAGTPVIAFGVGGACETVKGGETGLFFASPSVASLCAAIEEFESRRWDAGCCRRQAEQFSLAQFQMGMKAVIMV